MPRQIPLSKWIADKLVLEEDRQALSALSLMHYRGGKWIEVESKRIGGGSQPENPEALARLFHGLADSTASGLSGNQQFEILAFFGNDPSPGARMPFRKRGGDDDEDENGLGTEPPNKEGIVTQLMRHNEAVHRLGIEPIKLAFEAQQRIIDTLSSRNEKLEKEQDDVMELAREVFMSKAADMTAHDINMEKMRRSTNERAKLIQMLPVIVNTITGREVFPQSTADSAIIDAVADITTPEDIMKLSEIFGKNPMVWGPIAARLLKRIEAHKAAQAQSNQLPEETNGASPPGTH